MHTEIPRYFHTIPLLLLTMFLLQAAVPRALDAQLRVEIDTLDASAFPDIRMRVKVTKDNFAVRGLDITSFTVFEDGLIQVPIGGYCEDTLQQGPVSVLLVIDISRSMGPWPFGSNALVPAKRAARDFVDRLSTQDEAALLSFSDQPYFNQPWTQNKALLKQRIDELKVLGGTALYDAVIMGSTLISVRQNKKVMIVLADGDDSGAGSDFQEAEDAAVASGALVYTIGLGDINDLYLKRLASATGGKYFRAPNASDLDQIYFEISKEITSTGICELTYTSLIDCLNGSVVSVEVEVRNNDLTARESATYTLPYDTTTFSYVTLSIERDYVVEAGEHLTIPVELTRVTSKRSPSVFHFEVEYDRQLLDLVNVEVTALTQDYSARLTPTLSGNDITLQGTNTVDTAGTLLLLTFAAEPIFKSAKTEIIIHPPEVQQFCTVASSNNGLITVSGACERAISSAAYGDSVANSFYLTPNPFIPGTNVHFAIPSDGPVRLTVYNSMGINVGTLLDTQLSAGKHVVYLDAGDLRNGTYFLHLQTGGKVETIRAVLMK